MACCVVYCMVWLHGMAAWYGSTVWFEDGCMVGELCLGLFVVGEEYGWARSVLVWAAVVAIKGLVLAAGLGIAGVIGADAGVITIQGVAFQNAGAGYAGERAVAHRLVVKGGAVGRGQGC